MTWHYPILRFFRWLLDGVKWRRYHRTLGVAFSDCVEKFGDVVKVWDETSNYPEHEFSFRGIELMVAFENDVAIRIWQRSSKAFDDEFIDDQLNFFGDGDSWISLTDVPRKVREGMFSFGYGAHGRHLQRSDGQAWACIGTAGKSLEDREFHFDIVTGRWQRLKSTRYGVLRL